MGQKDKQSVCSHLEGKVLLSLWFQSQPSSSFNLVLCLCSHTKLIFRPASHKSFICMCACAQSCLTLCDPMDCSLPGSSVHEDSPGGMLEWVAMPSSRALGYLGLPKFLHKCFPGGSRIKNSPANAGDMDSITQSRRSPGGGNGNLLQYSCLP